MSLNLYFVKIIFNFLRRETRFLSKINRIYIGMEIGDKGEK